MKDKTNKAPRSAFTLYTLPLLLAFILYPLSFLYAQSTWSPASSLTWADPSWAPAAGQSWQSTDLLAWPTLSSHGILVTWTASPTSGVTHIRTEGITTVHRFSVVPVFNR